MKKLTQLSLLFLGFAVAFVGCEGADKAMKEVKEKAADAANVDLGDFDLKGLKSKFTAITDGFKGVTSGNVDGLTSKISELSGSFGSMGIDKLTGPGKTLVGTAISTFGDSIKKAMEGISDEGILSKLKPVVDTLMEKIKAMK